MNQIAHRPVTLAVLPEAVDHVRGSEHARVTMMEYGDFECPHCKTAAQTPTLLLDKFPGKVRFIFRHFPLAGTHPQALLAAEASEAAAAQGRFWQMHDLLFEHQAHLKDKDLYRYAGEAGLDLVRYKAEVDDHIYLQKVREHVEGGRRSHVRTTPTFFVDGVGQDNSVGLRRLHDAVVIAIYRAG